MPKASCGLCMNENRSQVSGRNDLNSRNCPGDRLGTSDLRDCSFPGKRVHPHVYRWDSYSGWFHHILRTSSPQIIARAQSFMVSQVPQLLTWASYFSVFLSDSLCVPNCCEINIMSADSGDYQHSKARTVAIKGVGSTVLPSALTLAAPCLGLRHWADLPQFHQHKGPDPLRLRNWTNLLMNKVKK